MTGPNLTDQELPWVTDIIDAIDAASVGDTDTAATLVRRLTPDQTRRAVSILVGIAAGGLTQLAAMSGVPSNTLIKQIRQQVAA